MPISSLVLEVVPGREREVRDRLQQEPGVEVRYAVAGKLLLVTDTPSLAADRALRSTVTEPAEVLTATVVFSSEEEIAFEVPPLR